MHHPLPSTSCRAVHCHRAAPSITVEELFITVNPSTAFKLPSLHPLMPIAVESPLCHPLSSHHAVHHLQDTIAPSFAVQRCCNHSPSALRLRHSSPSITAEEPSRVTSPSSRHCAVHRCPLLSITIVITGYHHCHRNCAVPCSITIEEPPHRPSPSRSHHTVN